MRWLVACLAVVGCGKHQGEMDRARAAALFDEIELPGVPPGISDLTVDEHGTLYAIPERARSVVELASLTATPVIVPLDGIPEGVDTEALAALGDGRFVIGTEGAHEATAAIAYAELRDGRMVVTRAVPLRSSELGVELVVNHGVEGVCGHGDTVIAAIETVGTRADGAHWAPLVTITGDAHRVTKLWLTSKVGKISALSCKFAADGTVEIEAIERHYEVSRILRATLAPGATEVTPTIELDLSPVLRNTLNLEGLVRLPDGRLVAVNDNEGNHAEGPTELLVFHSR